MRMFKFALLCLLSGFVSMSYADTASADFSPAQTQAIQTIVHDYLVKNPQVLVEVAQALQKQEQGKWQKTAQKEVPQIASKLFDDSTAPVMGNPNGDVTMVEFFDYQCPHCKEMSAFVDNLLQKDKNLRVVFKVLPIFGADSKFDSKIALAAYGQSPEKFMAFHDAMMKLEVPLTPAVALKVAGEVGLDVKKLQADMKNPAFGTEIQENYDLAKKLNLTGTPAFVMAHVTYDPKTKKMISFKNPVLVPGAVDEATLVKAIAEARGG
ncbi:MAG TPA: DsbA family protein [Gammaproteobacteria bacterium]|nr:DsbA family protein [Gammaproteobacteria bacterium]